MLRYKLCWPLLTAVCLCKPLHADQSLFVQHRSYHPVAALFGLPAAATRSDQRNVQLSVEHSNVFMGGASENVVEKKSGGVIPTTSVPEKSVFSTISLNAGIGEAP